MTTAIETKKVIVASPHGFCVGVARAVETIEQALKIYGTPLYCFHEIVHNQQIVTDLTSRGVIFVDSVEEAPPGKPILFSAHGVAPEVNQTAARNNMRVIDATCPFVTRIHVDVRKYAAVDDTIIIVGHRNHDEVVGISGEAPNHVVVVETVEEAQQVQPRDPEKVAVVTQTTLSMDYVEPIVAVLRERFPKIKSTPKFDMCYATTNRQEAVRKIAKDVDLLIVLGSENSSNSQRLVDVAQAAGTKATLVSSFEELDRLPVDSLTTLGLTSGASTPESFLYETLKHLASRGFEAVEDRVVVKESTPRMRLPDGVRS